MEPHSPSIGRDSGQGQGWDVYVWMQCGCGYRGGGGPSGDDDTGASFFFLLWSFPPQHIFEGKKYTHWETYDWIFSPLASA